MEEDFLQLQTVEKTEPTQLPINNQIDHQISNRPVLQFNLNGMPKFVAKKVEKLLNVLNAEVINMERLKECLAEGIPDEAALIREYSWKLILGYLPSQKAKWQESIEKSTKTYEGLVQMFLPP